MVYRSRPDDGQTSKHGRGVELALSWCKSGEGKREIPRLEFTQLWWHKSTVQNLNPQLQPILKFHIHYYGLHIHNPESLSFYQTVYFRSSFETDDKYHGLAFNQGKVASVECSTTSCLSILHTAESLSYRGSFSKERSPTKSSSIPAALSLASSNLPWSTLYYHDPWPDIVSGKTAYSWDSSPSLLMCSVGLLGLCNIVGTTTPVKCQYRWARSSTHQIVSIHR